MLRRAIQAHILGMQRVRLAARENTLSSSDRITEADYLSVIDCLGRAWIVESQGLIGCFVVCLRTGSIWALLVHPDYESHHRQLNCNPCYATI